MDAWKNRNIETVGYIDRWTQTDRQTDRYGRHRDRQTDSGQTRHTKTDRETHNAKAQTCRHAHNGRQTQRHAVTARQTDREKIV